MPESKGRPKPKNTQRSTRPGGETPPTSSKQAPNPRWFLPVMLGLMILGVLWVTTFYVTEGDYPVEIGYWNLAVGLGLLMTGFIMSTRWR